MLLSSCTVDVVAVMKEDERQDNTTARKIRIAAAGNTLNYALAAIYDKRIQGLSLSGYLW
jgi:hypothetical protein